MSEHAVNKECWNKIIIKKIIQLLERKVESGSYIGCRISNEMIRFCFLPEGDKVRRADDHGIRSHLG